MTAAYEDVVAQRTGYHCLLVAHAGVIRAIITHVLRAEVESLYRIKVDNAGITRIRHGLYGPMLEFVNHPGL